MIHLTFHVAIFLFSLEIFWDKSVPQLKKTVKVKRPKEPTVYFVNYFSNFFLKVNINGYIPINPDCVSLDILRQN